MNFKEFCEQMNQSWEQFAQRYNAVQQQINNLWGPRSRKVDVVFSVSEPEIENQYPNYDPYECFDVAKSEFEQYDIGEWIDEFEHEHHVIIDGYDSLAETITFTIPILEKMKSKDLDSLMDYWTSRGLNTFTFFGQAIDGMSYSSQDKFQLPCRMEDLVEEDEIDPDDYKDYLDENEDIVGEYTDELNHISEQLKNLQNVLSTKVWVDLTDLALANMDDVCDE